MAKLLYLSKQDIKSKNSRKGQLPKTPNSGPIHKTIQLTLTIERKNNPNGGLDKQLRWESAVLWWDIAPLERINSKARKEN